MEYSKLPIFFIPASIRRRLSRYGYTKPYASHRVESVALHRGFISSSEPHLPCLDRLPDAVDAEAERPSATIVDPQTFSSGSGSDGVERGEFPAKYEKGSGLRWNRILPALNLLRNAGYEGQQPQADSRLARSLYINALMYLLDALPQDLTQEEALMLQYRLPATIKESMTASPHHNMIGFEEGMKTNQLPRSKSYLHRFLATVIIQIFIIVQFLLPYLRSILRQIYEYERSHHVTQRIMTSILRAADGLGKNSVNVGAAICKFNEGRVATVVGSLAAWWIEGIAGGIYEGVGEGMMYLGLLQPGIELDRLVQIEQN
ncbi:hypothetical protein N7495_002152 [Penicillium taxi]|uniref:uncharacterized protein n=1 Tax=Penicillium taxi TaxID=168475 RepID=UPI002545570D|nr:uncharacterized protein N7495_002152 [Penicillium taxi]KAJ5901624.1 hypothetical protein N7495_002152 [Penicillium taxi]